MTTGPTGPQDNPGATRQPPRAPAAEEWERRRQDYRSRAGALDYELAESEGEDSGAVRERLRPIGPEGT